MKEYYIISLKWTKGDNLCFWRPKNSGYTELIDCAGIYSEEEVQASPDYYNDGVDTLAVTKETLLAMFKVVRVCKYSQGSIDVIKKDALTK